MASGRPACAAHPTYAETAPKLLDLGYAPIPIRPGSKVPAPSRWSSVPITETQVEAWARLYPQHGTGLRTGHLVGLDIDILDPDLAHRVQAEAEARFGAPLVRVGQWPKRLLLYRTPTPFRKLAVAGIEVLGAGQQFVAFGLHPGTGRPYDWPLGDTPLDVALADLPPVGEDALRRFLGEIGADAPRHSAGRARQAGDARPRGPVRDEIGRIVDGRDAWLSTIAYHAVHDAADTGGVLDPETIAAAVWERFAATADLSRSISGGSVSYGAHDAARKVGDKLRLLAAGRLPPRAAEVPEPDDHCPADAVEMARARLDAALGEACGRIAAWHADPGIEAAPRIGLKATVGLGKSAASRRHLLELRTRLAARGLPHRILVFVPSHALAEESAAEWRSAEASVAVLRGYERTHPVLKNPMCRDPEAVRAAIETGMDVTEAACENRAGQRCAFHAGCLKQANRREVADAAVIVAPYDALFSGIGAEPEGVALLLIDEACWPRAMRRDGGLHVETLDMERLGGPGSDLYRNATAGHMADLQACRLKLQGALQDNGPGALERSHLKTRGLAASDCRHAAELERRRLRDPGLHPGMSHAERKRAGVVAAANVRIQRLAGLWAALAALLEGPTDRDGRVRVGAPSPEIGLSEIVVTRLTRLHPNLAGRPILHLDATLRPEIVGQILPGFEVAEIEAAAPHMSLTLVAGGFGKIALCPDPRAPAEEQARRAKKLADCVDHVRWQARRVAPGRVLVVTYKDIEAAFAGIPGVEVAHFNAIAGLDAWGDVALLIVIGRPLPRDGDLLLPAAALFGHDVEGSYRSARAGVRMRDGSVRAVRIQRHEDPQAEILRAAICDDELIQAIGRGRGVNRTTANRLEVQVLADVALPLVHDRVTSWDLEAPDLIQQMLLAGIAVDSPADAAALHPGLLGNAEQAKKAFDRAGFKGHFPIRDTHRGLSLKSARYRRPGRGRGWQNAWWLDGDAGEARAELEQALGPLAGWEPQSPR